MNYYFMGKSNGRRMLIRVSLLRTVVDITTEECDDDKDMVNDSFADYTSELFSRSHHYRLLFFLKERMTKRKAFFVISLEDEQCPENASPPTQKQLKSFAPGEARTHGLQIMRLTRCLLRYRGG